LLNRRTGVALKDRDGAWSPVSASSSTNLLSPMLEQKYRERQFFGRTVHSRNTARWSGTLGSRFLRKFPFLIEVWYWLLVYWTYQLGRAFTAVTLQEDNFPIARLHALSLIDWEKKLGIFWELDVQAWFLARPAMLKIINCVYSFIHIPGTIFFLAWLYHYAPPALFEARRRTLAICNLMAFVVFTAWPCMPPRLLPEGDGFGFVDTVHDGKVSSVWTKNIFCNQLAAMPSLHFGYSFVIGLTIATLPSSSYMQSNVFRRIILVAIGVSYPLLLLVTIVATANHFILDAVAGFFVAIIGWHVNGVLCNLLPLEDYFYYLIHIHKPSRRERRDSGTASPADKTGQVKDWRRQA